MAESKRRAGQPTLRIVGAGGELALPAGPPLRRFAPSGQTPDQLIPGGLGPPAEIPREIFFAAVATFLEGKRLDMQALAAELGISRATLYRRTGDRDRLLGEVVWYLTRRAIALALSETEGLSGPDRVLAVAESFMRFVSAQPSFQRLLEAEPEASLRILTSRQGIFQPRLVQLTERLLSAAKVHGELAVGTDTHTLAFLIVRIGEGFIYADVIGDIEPDVDKAIELIGLLLSQGAPYPRSVTR